MSTSNSDSNRREDIEQMFYSKSLVGSELVLMLIYSPVGLCLFLLRLFIFLQLLLLNIILPFGHLRSTIHRYVFLILGVSIDDDIEGLRKLRSKLIISNHQSLFDPLFVNLIFPCHCLVSSELPWFIKCLIPNTNFKRMEENASNVLSKLLNDEDQPKLCFPESSVTNGRYGLMKFQTWPFTQDTAIHLIHINAKRFPIDLALSPLETNHYINLFWLFFLPITCLRIRFISSITRNNDESVEDYTNRVQQEMAEKTNLIVTNVTADDKEKLTRQNVSTIRRIRSTTTMDTNRSDSLLIDGLTVTQMASKVKEILPQVPLPVIEKDILITKNIDNTIDRLLSGEIFYIPELPKSEAHSNKILPTTSSSSTSTSTSASGSGKNISLNSSSKLFYCGAATFGKTVTERAKSYQERKELLFQQARERYLQQ